MPSISVATSSNASTMRSRCLKIFALDDELDGIAAAMRLDACFSPAEWISRVTFHPYQALGQLMQPSAVGADITQ